MDHVFSEGEDTGVEGALHDVLAEPVADGDIERVLALLDGAERPVIMAGTNLYWGRGEHALLELAERRGIPVYLNGQARGCVPGRPRAVLLARACEGLKGADVALVIGVPMDFRLGFGGVVRRGDQDRRHRPRRAGARRTRARSPASSTAASTRRCAR